MSLYSLFIFPLLFTAVVSTSEETCDKSNSVDDELPQVLRFSPKMTEKILHGSISLQGMKTFVTISHENSEHPVVDHFWDAASEFKNSGQRTKHATTFLEVNGAKEHRRIMNALDIGESNLTKEPQLHLVTLTINDGSPVAFPLETENVDKESILKYVSDFVNGKFDRSESFDLKKNEDKQFGESIKSAKALEENSNNDVVVNIVGNNFRDIVLENGKDVLLNIYAPWCNHCKALEPHYTALASKLKEGHISSVVLAKMDGTSNEVHGLNVKTFPTVLLFRAFDKEEGLQVEIPSSVERNSEAILNWLHKNSGMKFTKPL
eukprot:g4959.t1